MSAFSADSLIESMARAHLLKMEGLEWKSLAPASRELAMEAMRAAWAAAAEPTDIMKAAGEKHFLKRTAAQIWQAMHGAADGHPT